MENLNEFHKNIPGDYYEKLISNNNNPISKWFHNQRYNIIRNFVTKLYNKNKVIIDIGCGSCSWNINKLPVIGIDINKEMLKIGELNGNIKKGIASNIYNVNLPNNYADIIVCSEVLEHLDSPEKTLKEIKRLLKHDGIAFISVPYDNIYGTWFYLFNLQCIILGDILGKQFYKDRGGHVNNFSPKSIKNLIEQQDLIVEKQFSFKRLSIYNVVKNK